ncbi:MAG: acyl-CoA dehydrogenase [Nevskiaceae bacterium]|nr:MAG: acyl-CoA dehydrogenase [Nevskiaceae bacterium]TBR74637.1 MAG: acyl-CoA dehydrogenase [Nevskiaceae bacterium]
MLPPLYRHRWMDEDLEAFRDQLHRYVQAEIAPRVADWRKSGYVPRTVWRAMGEMGFLLPEISESYGGAGVNLAYQLVVQDEIAKAELPAATGVHTIAAHYIDAYGTEEQKQRWLPKLVSGELFSGIAMTEPGCGSDLKAIRTRAVRDGDDYVISGAKTFITNGYSGNFLLVVCRTGGEGSKGVSLIGVETADAKGFSAKRLEKIGLHASDTTELAFDDVRTPAASLLGPEQGHGFAQLMGQLPYERLLIAVPAVAAIEQAVELTVAYTQQRKAFGKPLYEQQNTRFKLAECATTAHIARTFVNDCIQRLVDGTLDDTAAYMAKCWCTDQQCKVIDECLQLFGGYGYMMEYPIARLYADARVQRIYGGANEIMKELIARKL